MITLAEPKPISSRVRDKIDELRQVQASSRTIHTVWWTAAVLACGVAIALALDAVFGWWSKPVRLCISLAVVASTIAVFVIAIRRVFAGNHDLDVARVGDRISPAMQERLQTVISAVDSDRMHSSVDRVMLDRVAHETDQLVDQLSAKQLRRQPSWWIPVLLLGIASLGCVAVAASVGSDIKVLVGRLLAPTSNLTRNQLEGLAGDQVIASGDSWETKFAVSGPLVKAVDLEREFPADPANSVENTREQIVLSPKNGSANEYRYRQHRSDKSFRYRLAAGDLRTQWYRVTVAERPRLTSVGVKITPPAYSQLEPKVFSRLPNRLTVIQGSTVDVVVHGAGKIAQAMLNIDSQSPRMMWSDDAIQFKASIVVNEEMVISPQLAEPNGLTNLRSPSCQILVQKDLPPSVNIKSPKRDTKVRPDDKVNITFLAKDDVGLAKMELVVEAESEDGSITTLDTKDIAVPKRHGEPAKTWEGKTQLDLSKYSLSEGQVLRYRLEVYDTRQNAMVEPSEPNQAPSEPTSSDTTDAEPAESSSNQSSSSRKESSGDQSDAANKNSAVTDSPSSEESNEAKSSNDQTNRADSSQASSETQNNKGSDSEDTSSMRASDADNPAGKSSSGTSPKDSSQPKGDASKPAMDRSDDPSQTNDPESDSDNVTTEKSSDAADKSNQSSPLNQPASGDMKRSDKSEIDKPEIDKPEIENSEIKKSELENSQGNQSQSNQSQSNQSQSNQSKQPTTKQPITKQPIAKQPIAKQSITKQPINPTQQNLLLLPCWLRKRNPRKPTRTSRN